MDRNETEYNAASLYEGGWRATDQDELKAEYKITKEEAEQICNKLAEFSKTDLTSVTNVTNVDTK